MLLSESETDRKMKAAKGAFDKSIDGGITFFDTAEVYGARVGLIFCLMSGNNRMCTYEYLNSIIFLSCRSRLVQ